MPVTSCPKPHVAARCADVVRHRLGDRRVIHYRGVRRMHGGHPGDVWLDLVKPREVVDAGEAWHAVLDGPAFDVGQCAKLGFVDGDDELAHLAVGQPLFLAELPDRGATGGAQHRLEGPGLVVEPGVNDAGVVAGLVVG